MADAGDNLRRCARCGGLVGYSNEELRQVGPLSSVYGVCTGHGALDGPVPPANGQVTLEKIVGEFLAAVTFDVRELFAADGTFKPFREVPRPLSMLVKAVHLKRTAPIEWAEVLGVPAAEVVEVKWTSQAELLLRAIEMLTRQLEAAKKNETPLTDEEVEAGALQYIAARFPEVAKAHPEVFEAMIKKENKS